MKKATSLIDHFSVIPDPRLNRQKRHNLIDIIVIAICGVICSCETWVDIEEYGNTKIDWFRKFLELPNGIPSHDTFGRVFSLLDPLEFQKSFQKWVRSTFEITEGEIISLDGKYFTASYREAGRSRSVLGMVSAWATNAGVSLAHKKADFQKEGEKKIMLELIEVLELKGCIVTMDAYGCQSNITSRIIEKNGDFVVGLKNNQKAMLNQMIDLFEHSNSISAFETSEKGHGRIEVRKCEAVSIPKSLAESINRKVMKSDNKGIRIPWKGLNTVCRIQSERTLNNKSSSETRYYISSLSSNAEKLLSVIRSHWNIENKLHHVLDVTFMEDQCRVRNGHAGENLAVMRRLALNLLKAERTSKRSINGKRLKSGWDNGYLSKVIVGATAPEFEF